MKISKLTMAGALFIALSLAGNAPAQSVGQWDFDNGNLSQTAGANLGDMTYIDGTTGQTITKTLFGTNTVFGIPAINGTNAQVMMFPGANQGGGYYMPTPPPNGGGSLLNEYTIIMDVLYTNGGVLRPLVQMDDGNFDNIHALFDVGVGNALEVTNTSGALNLASGAFGTIATNVWYRFGLTLDTTAGVATVYTNGVVLGILNFGAGNIDNPFAIEPSDVTPVFSSNVTNSPGFVNSLQIRDVVLNPGQMEALGGPSAAGIPINLPPGHSYIVSRTPNVGGTGINPQPSIAIIVDPGATTINSSTFALQLDGNPLTVSITADPTVASEYDVSSSVTSTILDPQSVHTLTLTYTDSLLGLRTFTWTFTVANYQQVTLPAPIYFENFDEVAEGTWPAGWSVTNNTVEQTPGFDLSDPTSDAYLSFVVISSNRVTSVFTDSGTYSSPGLGSATGERRLVHPPIELNGALVDSLVHGNTAYCDSDQRQNAGGQVDVMFSPDYNLTGHTNIYVAFKSTYEQNQDNIGSLEYSIDQGATWLPALYMLDDGTTDGDGSDVITNSTGIDVFATFGTPRSDQAYGLSYSNFIGAVVSTNLIPYISPRRNDDPISSKRIEIIRLPYADNQAHVRFRFGQAGTSSWYFGIDDFGIYTITTPVISRQPASVNADAGTAVSFGVTASGSPLTYQWRFNGVSIPSATNSTYSIANVGTNNVGNYQVLIGGITLSSPAVLTVNTTPAITTDLVGEITDPTATVTYNVAASGGRPLTFQLYKDGSLVSTLATSQNVNQYVFNNVQAADAGNYQLVVMNSYGSVAGSLATLKVYQGPLNSNLVVHLPFDGSMNDTSGRGNNATYMSVGANASPTARFAPGKFGQAFEFTTMKDDSVIEYASLGYPADLQFGATNDFSVSMWVNYTNQSDDLPFISNKDWDSSSHLGWGIFSQSGGNYRINVTGQNGGSDKFSQTDTPNTLKDGNWHHIVVSFQKAPFGQNAYVYGYLDGVLVSKHSNHVGLSIDTFGTALTDAQPIASPQSSWAVNIGQDGTGVYTDGGSAYNINALIDDVGIWRRALTPNEVAGIYMAGQNGQDLSQAVASSKLYLTVSGSNVNLNWVGSPTFKLQTTTSLSPANWTDVPGTLGASSAVVSRTSSQAFFRLSE